MAQATSVDEQLLTFEVSGQSFALPARLVQEVTPMPRIARVPRAPEVLLGLANLRGAVVPVLSTARLLDRQEGVSRRLIVVDAGEQIGLAVDNVAQIVGAAQLESALQIDVPALIAKAMIGGEARRSRGVVTPTFDLQADQAERVTLVTFAIGDQDFALPIGVVSEVRRLPAEIAIMPHSDAVVIGSTLVRGALLPLLSLHALLGLPGRTRTARSRVLVVLIGSHRVGLVVDAMREILQVPEGDIDPVPQVLSRGGAEARIQAICRIEGNRLVSVLAADQLVREDITARLLQGQSGERDMAEQEIESATEQFLLFRIGAEEFGLPIGAVEEVVSLPPKLTPLPRAPAFVQGVMNLRGQVLPVIDQVQRFSGSAATGQKRRVIVVRIGDLQAGFIVDAVSEILRVPAADLRAAPDLGNEDTRVFERVANLAGQNRIVLIVSPRELLDRAERDLLASLTSADAAAGP